MELDKQKLNQFAQAAIKGGVSPTMVKVYVASKLGQIRPQQQGQTDDQSGFFGKILSKAGQITQKFGNRSSVEKYSGGINYGTDIAVPTGTKVFLPEGKWKVVDSFGGAKASGPNNKEGGINRGYGNSVLVQNLETGEKLRFSHLSGVNANKGQVLNGGNVIGLTGATGNVAGRTGQHLDLEYYNSGGKLMDILKSRYARYV